ncbi:hypothetical protein BDGGKGIB_01214 [Nodularia sphaerocarpa UHCC 0038]|nr:hypothetical protein BDGGKGIB_01214 [Nodularia sphaerocarpa UHCC 0038]
MVDIPVCIAIYGIAGYLAAKIIVTIKFPSGKIKRGTSLRLLANPVCRSLKRGEH